MTELEAIRRRLDWVLEGWAEAPEEERDRRARLWLSLAIRHHQLRQREQLPDTAA